jgi:hypothetical protein
MILVPTDRGRVGVAPASEQQLLAALAAAARIQQRLDEVAGRARAFASPEGEEHAASAVLASEQHPIALAIAAASEEAPAAMRRLLTGIERTLLEERLAADRAAALLAAEEERQAVADAARMAAFIPAVPVGSATTMTAPARIRRRGQWRRPAWMTRPELVRPATLERRPFPVPTERLLAYGLVVMPAIAAGALWLAAVVNGRLEMPVEQLRPVAVALLAAGPAGALAGLVAQTWFPRLVGLVAITSLAALGLIGRGLLV